MNMKKTQLVTLGLATAVFAAMVALPLGAAQGAGEAIDYAGLAKIKAEGMQNSQVMELASWMTDVHGPRLSGSPNIQQAGEWAVAELKKMGLQNVAMEPWTDQTSFPRGWSNDKFYLAAVTPQAFPMTGMSTAWTPGTNGLIRGEAVLVTSTDGAELQKLSGTLKGKFVLTQAPPDVAAFWTPQAERYTKEQLDAMENAPRVPELGAPAAAGRGGAGAGRAGGAPGGGAPFNRNDFFLKEGVAGVLTTSARGHGLFTIGGNRSADPATTLPAIVVTAEHYGRVARMLMKNIPVTLEADIKNTFHPTPTMFNVVAEIPGTDKADEVVMLGGHLDSWHSATGATDNAAGSAIMMEAARILQAIGVRPRRTIRVALWGGEEQGLLGSRAYVAAHFGSAEDPLPEFSKFNGYFNIDSGTGRVRGFSVFGPPEASKIVAGYLKEFEDFGVYGATASASRAAGGTDSTVFNAAGIPGIGASQDPIEYNSHTWHTNLDTYERIVEDDVKKSAIAVASAVYHIAMREQMLPRFDKATMPAPPAPPAGRGGGGAPNQ